ncbi:ABC transporter permease [Diplocloster agilis]|uniref:ABC transporter permease n=1 Tax=Diplocloster agilis TaxID=2850323 RepID=UPI0008202F66|nr:ABC transporter permease [Suonthocola fibrivorans]MCU6735110.1 ABC transporter permease [Suonthocola fibrivorans]SCJ64522.1 Glutathione transport system permease protein gsiC [uncultured Clostridium sp.]
MGRYILKRLLWMIPIILGVAVLVFTLMTFCPGDPAKINLGSTATEADYTAMREQLGLDRPFMTRLGNFLSDTFVKFDFGKSWSTGGDIKQEMLERLPRTMLLSTVTLFLAIVIGMPLGIVAAVKQNKWQDKLCMTIALTGVSIPNFWLSLLLILLFSVKLEWLPAMGIGSVRHYILPAMAGCVGNIATLARQTRSSMLDVIRSDYITTARAKGVKEFHVITRHALKNALIPIITVIGTYFGRMLGGAMILETIFSIPGMGMYIVGGVGSRDYPVVQTGSIFLAIVFSFSILLVDLIYAVVDPRIKAQYERRKGR